MKSINDVTFIKDFIGIHDRKMFEIKSRKMIEKYLKKFSAKEIKKAADKAYSAYSSYLALLREKGSEIIEACNKEGKDIIVLAGRPYHVDPQVNHGIDKLISSFNVGIITEESISHLVEKQKLNVLNQWTYHSRLYHAANFIKDKSNMNLVQLVSFGCGLDAITTDETKAILERNGKIYTQIKIDEITNLGAVRIRLRSLFSTLDQNKRGKRNG